MQHQLTSRRVDMVGLAVGTILFVSALVLAGWFAGVAALRSLAPVVVAMAPDAALCFLLAGFALWQLSCGRPSLTQRSLAIASAVMVIALSVTGLAGAAFGYHWALETLSGAQAVVGEPPFGYAVHLTMFALLLAGLAVVLNRVRSPRWGYVRRLLTVGCGCIGIVGVAGEVLRGLVFGGASVRMEFLQSAPLLALLSAGIIGLDPAVSSRTAAWLGNPTSRRFLVAAILFPVVINVISGYGEFAGAYSLRLGAAFTVLTLTAIASRVGSRSSHRPDESERKRVAAEETVRSQEGFLREIIDSVPNPIYVRDQRGTFTLVNQAAADLLGVTPEELVGKRESGPNADDAERIRRNEQVALCGPGQHIISEDSVRDATGTERWFLTRAVRSRSGGDWEVLEVATDITDRKHAEEQLRRAKQAAERASAAKSEFLSRVSHELRTPLNAVLGFAQILETRAAVPESREAADQILRAGKHMLDLINEVLDITRIESGRLAISLQPVDLRRIVLEAAELVRPLADGRGIRILTSLPTSGVYAIADPQRLQEILLNLFSNAVKFNRPDGVVQVRWNGGAPGCVRLEITDTGPGVPEESRERLFRPFERLPGSEYVEGTGLGLALSRKLAELMDGTVGLAESGPDGSTFFVELGAAPSVADSHEEREDGPSPRNGAARTRATKVLYIEDNFPNLQLVTQWLQSIPGFEVLAAKEGRAGLRIAREELPDLVLLDVHLPDISGREVLRELAEDPATRHIPVVVISADATDAQKRALLAAGARAYLTKPLDLDSFTAAVKDSLPSDRAA